MTVLSDKTIKEMIEKGQLIHNSNANNADYCSYEFTADSILRGGSHKVEQLTDSDIVIEPAQLVWIKAKEEISLPTNMVGLWIQTQTLARDGLLLLNITLIEPGYEGPLSAVLVNFGKKRVPISSNTKIAKVVFLSLDKEATKGVPKWDGNYKDMLINTAANAPETFLHLQSLLPDIEKKANAKLAQIDKEIDNIIVAKMPNIQKDLQGGVKLTLIKWGGLTLAGLLLGCGLVWLMMTSYLPRLSEYSKFDELARRAAITQQAETINKLDMRLLTLTTEIESLKWQLSSVKAGDNEPQRQDNPPDTTRLTSPDNTVPKQ